MEMAVQLKKRSLQASVQWTPKTANREADSLANGNTQNFNPDYECVICPDSFEWLVLPQALERGREAEDEFRVFRGEWQRSTTWKETDKKESRG